MNINEVSTKEQDFLDQDAPIRNQNFVCMSFLSPEDVLKNKEVYFVSNFVDTLGKQVRELLASLEEKYPQDKQIIDTVRENHQHFMEEEALQSEYKVFLDMNAAQLEKKFYEQNGFRTTIRGFKVRGVYDTYPEATNRAQVLKKSGDKFDIFVAQVGCWCPWSPNPSDLENQEYAETQLNTLMKGYHENNQKKDEYYEMRKKDRLEAAQKDLDARKEALEVIKQQELEQAAASLTIEEQTTENAPVTSAENNEALTSFLTSEDPWSANKNAAEPSA